MARLVVLNGPPGIGKSTLARRYVDDHPFALALEQDVVRRLLGGWRGQEHRSGSLARELCLAMARSHLLGGYDVVVPQLVAVPAYLDRLAGLAAEVGATYVEVVLLDSAEAAERRFRARGGDPLLADHQEVAALEVEQAGGYRSEYERLLAGIAGRQVVEIRCAEGDVDGAYRALLAALTR